LNNDQLSSAIWFFIGLAICVVSIFYKVGTPASPGAGFMPFCSGASISILSSVGFLRETMKRRQGEKWSSLLPGPSVEECFNHLDFYCGLCPSIDALGFPPMHGSFHGLFAQGHCS
jgi:hypothetical protein